MKEAFKVFTIHWPEGLSCLTAVSEIDPKFQIEDLSVSLKEVLQVLAQFESGIIIKAVRNKQDVIEVSGLMKWLKSNPQYRFKIAVCDYIRSRQAEKVYAKIGIMDFINEGMAAKALKYKLDLWYKAIGQGKTQGASSEDQKLSDKRNVTSTHETNPESNEDIDFLASEQINDDIWFIKSKKQCKKVMGKWMVKILGPGPHCAQFVAVPEKKNLYHFQFKSSEPFDFLPDGGDWFYQGDTKPDFSWKDNLWIMTGQEVSLLYRNGDSIKKRISLNAQEKQVRGNSRSIEKKMNLILSSIDPELVSQKKSTIEVAGNMSADAETEILNIGPMQGKGSTDRINRSNLQGESETDRLDSDFLRGNLDTDSSSLDKETPNLKGAKLGLNFEDDEDDEDSFWGEEENPLSQNNSTRKLNLQIEDEVDELESDSLLDDLKNLDTPREKFDFDLEEMSQEDLADQQSAKRTDGPMKGQINGGEKDKTSPHMSHSASKEIYQTVWKKHNAHKKLEFETPDPRFNQVKEEFQDTNDDVEINTASPEMSFQIFWKEQILPCKMDDFFEGILSVQLEQNDQFEIGQNLVIKIDSRFGEKVVKESINGVIQSSDFFPEDQKCLLHIEIATEFHVTFEKLLEIVGERQDNIDVFLKKASGWE